MDDSMNIVEIFVRWIHISAAILAIGTAIVTRYVVLPLLYGVAEERRVEVNERIRATLAKFAMISIAFLLMSGLYNYLVVQRPLHAGQAAYHAVMGVKIMLALLMFFLSSALTGKSEALEGIRRKRKRWLSINIFLGLAIVALAGVLRAMPTVEAAPVAN
jgi:uncharacterized membrane protein